MLRAYDYAEKRVDDRIRDSHILNREREIALRFVLEHPTKKTNRICPFCGSTHTGYVFDIWNVDYLRCDGCESIFVPVDERVMREYQELEGLKTFRKDPTYQSMMTEIRGVAYEEHVRWLKYRIFRYLKKRTGISLIDFGDKYKGFIEKLDADEAITTYELRESVFSDKGKKRIEKADVVMSMNQLQHEANPLALLRSFKSAMADEGILIINTRLGSGFDVLALKGSTDDLYPYEHIMLPSKKGVEIALDHAGYELLEITTPGTRDINVVKSNLERIGNDNLFVRYLMGTSDERMLMDFQQFLQKNCLSSFVRLIARKKAA